MKSLLTPDRRLLDALSQVDPKQIEQLFGDEYHFGQSTTVKRAPVKRVAIIAEAFLPKLDGVSKTAFLTLRYLQETGREVIVFAPDTAPTAIGASTVIALPSLGIPAAPETRVALPNLNLAQHLEDFKPDIIHMFSPALLSANAMVAGRRMRVPVIANYQTDLPGYSHDYGLSMFSHTIRDWLRFIHNNCHLTLVPSHYTLNELRQWHYHRLRVWGRGVNSVRFSPEQRSQAWRDRLLNGRDPDSLICLYVGRLANEKRVELLLDIAKTEGIALTIIGDGALRDDLEAQFAGTNTHFMGYLWGDELAQAYASADIFAFTGTRETFGQVVQEAMAAGLPCIVADQGGVTDLVINGENGYTCPANSAAFAQAARRLLEAPTQRQQMGHRARQMAEERPWEAIMESLEGFYSEAIRLNDRYNELFQPAEGLQLPIPMPTWPNLFWRK